MKTHENGRTRRSFVKAALGAITAPAVAASLVPGRPITRRVRALQDDDFELEEATLSDMAEAMASGLTSSRRLTERYLERIEAIDRSGPTLRSVLDINPEALDIAERLDRERAAGRLLGPLHGIPVMLKDNIDTADRMTTTAGSLALEGSTASRDSGVASRLRAAGAVLLAKTNLSEWANFRSNNSSSGWSGRGGQCKNPYVLDRNPCGSSSGSGAATSANLCAAAIGTETNGSIVCPANANGLVGLKPTVGLVSRAGIIPISATQDTAGPMTRTVRDAAILLGALTGVDERDPATRASAGKGSADYASALNASAVGDGSLNGRRIGVWREVFDFDARVESLAEQALARLEKLGATLHDVVIPNRREVSEASYEVMLYEFKDGLNRYFASLADSGGDRGGDSMRVRSLAELIEFNERNKELEMPWFGQEILLEAEAKGSLEDQAYQSAREKALRLSRDEGLDRVLSSDRLDAIVAPTGGPAWVTDWVNGDHFSGGSSSPAAISGYPNITVPMGDIHGLPVGLSFFGAAWSEATLLQIAYAFEQSSRRRITPTFRPTVATGR